MRIPMAAGSPEVAATPALGFVEHPLRHVLTNEVHARPYETFRAPVRATHLAVISGEGSAQAEYDLVAALCDHFGQAPPSRNANHCSRDMGAFRLRWERHTEFSTYTILRFDPFDEPFVETALSLVPRDWLDQLPGSVLVAKHLALETAERSADDMARLFEGNAVIGSRMLGGAACAWTDFRIHSGGFGRILVRDQGMTEGQGGRLMQRLLEIETYRMMALLAFPVAREAGPVISRIDQGLADITGRIAASGESETDRALLDRLTGLAAEVEQVSAATSYRISAARAYKAIVNQRIEELREERIPGTQTIGEFMSRRLDPAMKTCESVAERLDALSRRVARAGDLLRTRVDIALEEKNRDLLNSMNRRAQLQLRLQETVEGLSVVAISYYLLGLLGYAAKGAKAGGLPINPDVAVLAGIPVVVGLVWLGVRRLRKALTHGEDDRE
ncbi:DUF3422 family protein [Telmatospirillum sp. J64-1]|uniref:DUF3422 family protein n=1 Tax=Telmatospirillum sp. J64-1 TaxID=2502183 RepID=UPI00210729FE|nr:DUF3422 domain-containing protein [Telmatospirillum sp. J64-1]